MTWSVKGLGSWGIATTTAPATDMAAVLALPGSWPYFPYGATALVRKDQWANLLPVAAVDTISPDVGPIAGSTGVTINGSGFIGATGVTFGGTAATGFIVNSDETITCITPAHAAGAVAVVVLSPRGNATVPNGFTFE